jgi:hypothetical protein
MSMITLPSRPDQLDQPSAERWAPWCLPLRAEIEEEEDDLHGEDEIGELDDDDDDLAVDDEDDDDIEEDDFEGEFDV